MSTGPVIHLVNPMWNAFGGSEQRVLQLYGALRPRTQVWVWSEQGPDPRLSAKVPVRRIDRTQHPVGGTLVVVGNYFTLGPWLAASYPRRIIFVVNLASADAYQLNLQMVASTGATAEIVYASEALRELIGMPGRVEPSPIDVERFASVRRQRDAKAPFVVGRLSRDAATKHHEEDPRLYAELSRRGCEVRIMGGSVLAERGCPPQVRLLREGALPADEFLQGLDCFLYRTPPQWYETYGRVVFEAMASGLPVVVHERGGYTDYVLDGHNGLHFDTTERAIEQVLRVRDEPGLRERLVASARDTIATTYCKAYWSRLAEYYLG
jgi:glycosyltransferase involved in cell wall biosynthesis